jgi:pyrroloquinoline quinone biosynthesis protein B
MRRTYLPLLMLIVIAAGCKPEKQERPSVPYLVILGIAQDAGYPQAGCVEPHCMKYWSGKEESRFTVSLGLIDPISKERWLFEATPDFKEQLHLLNEELEDVSGQPEGIFLTHAHMGHYTGLMHLGREAMGADGVPVYTLPRMYDYLKANGPWSQLVDLCNISLKKMQSDSVVELNSRLRVAAIPVPHRDEFSETAAFLIQGEKTALFIPDIDKWTRWEEDIREWIKEVDYAFLDATFYDGDELPNRDMSEIPHPFVVESMQLFEPLEPEDRAKVTFIHFNHSNPLIFDGSKKEEVEMKGFKVARRLQVFPLE